MEERDPEDDHGNSCPGISRNGILYRFGCLEHEGPLLAGAGMADQFWMDGFIRISEQ